MTTTEQQARDTCEAAMNQAWDDYVAARKTALAACEAAYVAAIKQARDAYKAATE